MTKDVSPILDRHVQERLGRKLREKLDCARAEKPSTELEALLAALRVSGDRRGGHRPIRD